MYLTVKESKAPTTGVSDLENFLESNLNPVRVQYFLLFICLLCTCKKKANRGPTYFEPFFIQLVELPTGAFAYEKDCYFTSVDLWEVVRNDL